MGFVPLQDHLDYRCNSPAILTNGFQGRSVLPVTLGVSHVPGKTNAGSHSTSSKK